MHIVTEIQLAFGFRPPSAIITDTVKTFCTEYESCDTNYINFLSCLYSVRFLCQLLFDINLVHTRICHKLYWQRFASLDLLSSVISFYFSFTFYCFFVLLYFSTILVNKDEHITGPPNGPIMICSLASVVVVCRRRMTSSVTLQAGGRAGRWACGRSGGRHCTAGQYCYVPLGRQSSCYAGRV